MNRLFWGVLSIALLLPAFGAAQTAEKAPAAAPAAAATTAKIAWMEVEKAVLGCDEGAKMVDQIQKFIETKNTELDALRKEAEDLRAKLSVQGQKLNDDARQDLEDKAVAKDTMLQRFEEDTRKEIDARKNRLTAYISKRMGPVIEKVAKAKGLDAVLIWNPSRDAWFNASLNVTDEIIKAYNKEYPVAAAKPPAAKP